jgi:O-antigen/teichoic acid export membrane protein
MTIPAPQRIERSLGKRLVRGASWALVGRMLGLPAGLLVAVLLSRLLEPAALGAYFLAMSLIGLGTILGQLGLARPMVMLVPAALATGRPAAARHAVVVAFAATAVASLFLALLLVTLPGAWLAGALDDRGELARVLPLVATIMVVFALIDLAAETFRGFEDLRSASFLTNGLAQRLIAMAGFALLFLAGVSTGLGNVLAITLAAAVVVVLAVAILLHRYVRSLGGTGRRWSTRHVLGHGPSFMVIRLNLWLLAGADLWALGFFRPTDEVALYGAAARLAVLVGVPLLVCNAVVAPVAAELHAHGRSSDLERAARSSATLSLLAAGAASLVFWLFGGPILGLMLGEPYAAAAPLLGILALGQLARVAFGPASIVLTMTGYQREVMLVGIATSLVTLLALALLAPRLGGPGVAWAVTGSITIHSLILAVLVQRRLGILPTATARPRDLAFLSAALLRTFRRR